jgi:RNA polymerase primary sigma factor
MEDCMQKKTSKLNDSMLDSYFRQVRVFPLLTFEEELMLSKEIQEENNEEWQRQAALHKLINSNLRLVIKIAGSYNTSGISIMDLIQEGNIGLIRAAKKFDYRKNFRFCTYASWWIRQYISRYISNKRRLVRLPERKEETLRKIQRAYHVLCQTLMHQPKTDDIAKELGISVQDVNSFINLTTDISDENVSTVDIHEDYTYSPEQNLMKQAFHDGTMRMLNKLKDKEKRILSYRYQLNGCERHTLREIGHMLNISPETVRQMERRALKKIRNHANELKECLYVEAI